MNKKQYRWIWKEIDKLNKEYMPKIPFTQDVWDNFKDDVNDLYEKSKRHKGVERILIELIVFYDVYHVSIDSKYDKEN